MNNHPKHPVKQAFIKRNGNVVLVKVLKRQFAEGSRNWKFLIEFEGNQERVTLSNLHKHKDCFDFYSRCHGACWNR